MSIFGRITAAGLLVLALAGCDESPVSLPEAASVAVSGSTMSLSVGDQAPVAAQVLDQDGRVMQGLAPVFSTDNPSVVTVSSDGMVRGVGPGAANVTAAYGSGSAVVKVTVTASAARVAVPAAAMALAPGDGAPLGAQVLNQHGQPVPGAAVVYSTDNPAVATVGTDGMVRAVGPGAANVTAAYGSSTAAVRVTVVAGAVRVTVPATTMSLVAGDGAPLGAQVLNQHGQPVAGAMVVYSTDNPGVAVVSPDGTVRGISPGVANVTAAFGSSAATVRVTVVPNTRQEVATLDVLVDSLVTDRRAGVQPVAFRATNGYGQAVCPSLDVRSSDPSVATVRNGGTCRIEIVPHTAGETTITVGADGRTDSFRLRVTSTGATGFFSARPSADELVAGATVSYTVKVVDQANQPVAGQAVNFEVGVGSLSATTVVTAADGTATVQWQIPTDLRAWGQTSWISYRTTHQNGGVGGRVEDVFINGASLAEVVVYAAPNGGTYMRMQADSIVVPAYSHGYMAVTGRDAYGNTRVVDWTFSAAGSQSWFWSCNGPGGSPFSPGGEYTCFYSYPGILTVTARAATGEQRTLRFIFRY